MTPQDDAKRLNTPPLQGRGLSANTIAEVHGHAAAMRRNPIEPEKRLWRALSGSQLGGSKFRRQATIGRVIVDFLCPSKRLIVEVDGDTHVDPTADARRDAGLAAQDYRVVRVSNEDVMRNIEGVLAHLLSVLAEAPHPNPSPEGEGLEDIPAQKRLRISLNGSVG